ncbi:LysR family transcriptional regulator [Dyella tabacisoli]|nr:LysR family transcriptional regulator [Dyella tabacisoli]
MLDQTGLAFNTRMGPGIHCHRANSPRGHLRRITTSTATDMHLRYLKTFLAVASSLSFTRAAEQVHLAQSSVTEQIQALEADLGAALFDRTQRRLRLTEAGKRLRKYAHELLALADEARASIADIAGDVSGMLVVGGLETICAAKLPSLLAAFKKTHPAMGLQLKVANSAELRGEIGRGSMDVGFGFGEPPSGADLQGDIVGYEDLVVIAPPAHRLRSQASVTTADLATESFLLTGPGCVYRTMFEQTFPADGAHRPCVVGEFDSLSAIRSLVASGVGCAMVPRAVVAIGGFDALCLPWAEGTNAVPISMFWHRRRQPSPVLELFLDAARKGL